MRRIIVTGASGNLGQKAVAALESLAGTEVLKIDIVADGSANTALADLSNYDQEWANIFQGADIVLHLAGEASPTSNWSRVRKLNVDLTLNVMRAAEQAKVSRFVFASSNWVMGGHRFGTEKLRSSLSPQPLYPYGATKLLLERCGLNLSERTEIDFLSLRIGLCRKGHNVPHSNMAHGRWGQEMWLSNEDWAQAVVRSCLDPFSGYADLNIVSDNLGMRWDLDEARKAIGYVPISHYTPILSARSKLIDAIARVRANLFHRLHIQE